MAGFVVDDLQALDIGEFAGGCDGNGIAAKLDDRAGAGLGGIAQDRSVGICHFGDLGVELSDLGLNADDLECNTCAAVPTLFEGMDGE